MYAYSACCPRGGLRAWNIIFDWDRNQPTVRRKGGGEMLRNHLGIEVRDGYTVFTGLFTLRLVGLLEHPRLHFVYYCGASALNIPSEQ